MAEIIDATVRDRECAGPKTPGKFARRCGSVRYKRPPHGLRPPASLLDADTADNAMLTIRGQVHGHQEQGRLSSEPRSAAYLWRLEARSSGTGRGASGRTVGSSWRSR